LIIHNFINLSWGHVRSGPTQNLGLIGLAVLTFIWFKRIEKQTDRQWNGHCVECTSAVVYVYRSIQNHGLSLPITVVFLFHSFMGLAVEMDVKEYPKWFESIYKFRPVEFLLQCSYIILHKKLCKFFCSLVHSSILLVASRNLLQKSEFHVLHILTYIQGVPHHIYLLTYRVYHITFDPL